jgi:hypothetical protein
MLDVFLHFFLTKQKTCKNIQQKQEATAKHNLYGSKFHKQWPYANRF